MTVDLQALRERAGFAHPSIEQSVGIWVPKITVLALIEAVEALREIAVLRSSEAERVNEARLGHAKRIARAALAVFTDEATT